MIRETIAQIDAALLEEGGQYRLIFREPQQYYRHGSFLFTRTDDFLVIAVDFPLVLSTISESFDVFEIQVLPQTVPSQSKALMYLRDPQEGIAICKSCGLFYFLSHQDVSELRVLPNQLSHRRVFRTITMKECIIAIFFDDVQSVRENCKYEIVLNVLVPETLWLELNSFLFTGVSNYDLTCGSKVEVKTGCKGQCVVKVPSKCTIRSNFSMIAASFDAENGSVQHVFPINRPLIAQFFDINEIKAIKADSVFMQDQVDLLAIPPMKIFKNPSEDFLTQDDRLKLAMDKVVSAMKADNVIMHTAADQLMATEELGLDSSWDWSMYLLIAISVFLVLILLQTLYLTVKLRSALVLIAVLERAVKVDAQEVVNNLQFKYATMQMTEEIPLKKNFHYQVVSLLSDGWVYLIITVVVGGIGIYALRRFVKVYCHKLDEMMIQTELILQLNSGGKSLVMCLEKMYALDFDVKLVSMDTLREFEVKGFFQPYLTFLWNAKLVDSMSGQTRVVSTWIKLSWVEAYIARKILSKRFFAAILFRSQGKLSEPIIEGERPVKQAGISRSRKSSISRSPSVLFIPEQSGSVEMV